jgi:tetratricopeptide (TPR) repeat protein
MFAVNRQMGNYENSFYYAQQLNDIAEKSGNPHWMSDTFWGLAELFTLTENYPEALAYYARARAIHEPELKKDSIQTARDFEFEMESAELFSLINRFDSAWFIYQRYKPNSDGNNNLYLLSTGECYFLQGNFQKALLNFRQSLDGFNQRKQVYELMRTLLDIARVYEVLDEHKLAIDWGQKALQLATQTGVKRFERDGFQILTEAYTGLNRQDSSNFYFRKYSLVKEAVLNDQARGKLAAYSYQHEISLMNKEKQIREIQMQKQTLLKNVLLGSLIVLVLFAFIFSRNILLKRRSEARKRQLAENELQIQKLQSEKSQAELLQQRSELEMKALRAQMNPHFIFNCLNAINRFIIQNNADKAADYLTKFAKLIRIVLEKSGQPFIPLQEDLHSLRLYMDLESIRFEKPFLYEIHSDGIDQTLVLVPSLLIQPFVENAIWHGLHPVKNRQGKITIHLELENDLLLCTICDNGAGRKKTPSKENEFSTSKSLGIQLTSQRLQLTSERYTDQAMVSFQDLKDETGYPTGTCVHIKIPIKKV